MGDDFSFARAVRSGRVESFDTCMYAYQLISISWFTFRRLRVVTGR
jgi:hypothetical protein